MKFMNIFLQKNLMRGIPFYNGDFDTIRSSLDLVSEISFNSDIKKTYKKNVYRTS